MSRRKLAPKFISPGTQLEIGVTYWDHKKSILFLAMSETLLVTVLPQTQELVEVSFEDYEYKIEKLPDYPPAGILALLWGVDLSFLDSLIHIYLRPELFRDTEKRVHNDVPQRDADAEAALFEEVRKYRCYTGLEE